MDYIATPKPTAFNVAVFFRNFAGRQDARTLGEAFCHDFDVLDSPLKNTTCEQEAIRMILHYKE